LKLSAHNRHWLPCWGEKFGDAVLCEKRSAEDTQYLVDTSVEIECFLDDSHRTIGYYGGIDLDAHSDLAVAPEFLDLEVLLYPFEESLHFPSVLIEQGNVSCPQEEVVGVVGKCPLQLRGIIDNPPYFGRVMGTIAFGRESHCLVLEDIVIPLKDVFSGSHFVFGPEFLPYNEKGVQQIDAEQPSEIPVPLVKDIAGAGFIFNPVHRIDIMDFCIGDIESHGNVCNDIVLGMHLDSRFGAPELCPFKKFQTKRNGRGIKCIVLPMKSKLTVNPRILCKIDHIIGKTFKKVVISKLIRFGQSALVYWQSAKTEMERLAAVCGSKVRQLTKTATSLQLAVHEYHQLAPWSQFPSFRSIFVFCRHPFKLPFGDKVRNLAENVFALVHACLMNSYPSLITFSKVRQAFCGLNY